MYTHPYIYIYIYICIDPARRTSACSLFRADTGSKGPIYGQFSQIQSSKIKRERLDSQNHGLDCRGLKMPCRGSKPESQTHASSGGKV